MNSDKKKNQSNKKPDVLQEPKVIYVTEDNSIMDNSENIDSILEKLILKSIQDSKEGNGISLEQMMQNVKVKYTFLK